MTRLRVTLFCTLAVAGLALGGYAYWHRATPSLVVAPRADAAERTILYYRDPSGAPNWSATPKTDAQGRAYLPVYGDAEPSFDPPPPPKPTGDAKIIYYRNPMGLPDTSPVPKKDSMGMDYIPVYAGDAPSDGGTVKISVERIQRSGVRTEAAESRVLVRPVRAVGTVAIDERRATVVTMRSDGYVEELYVNTTGQDVHSGQPLFRVYSADIQQALTDMLVAKGWPQRGSAEVSTSGRPHEGAMQKLRNLGLSESRIHDIHDGGTIPRAIDWLAPAGGTVMVKRVINGQKISAGDELYRIVDLSRVWIIADVAEGDIADIKAGDRATVTFRAYRGAPVEGTVT